MEFAARPSLLLVRHAQSANNALPDDQRVPDPGITPIGIRQAERLADQLGSLEIQQVITSAFRRALQTANAIRKRLNVPVSVEVDLHEHGGCYSGWHPENYQGQPGMTRGEILDEFGDIFIPEDFPQSGWWQSQPRESGPQSDQRAEQVEVFLRSKLIAAQAHLVCITHADFLAKLLTTMFGTRIQADPRFQDLANTGITQVGLADNEWTLYQLNFTEHLPGHLVTS